MLRRPNRRPMITAPSQSGLDERCHCPGRRRSHVGRDPAASGCPVAPTRTWRPTRSGTRRTPDCEWETAEPSPAFAQRGAAIRVSGALVAELVERKDPEGWALTVRQELHPDDFYRLRTELAWLRTRAAHAQDSGIEFVVGYLRLEESVDSEPFLLVNGPIQLPEDIESHTPDWQGA
jgi:hypothetical protein